VAAPGAFEGWTEDFQPCFIGLELDNSKAYFEARKKLYLELVKRPMELLLAELEPEFGKGKIFRANRDIRFSADKRPYKTNLAATAEKGGYVSLDSKGLVVGGGRYHLDKPGVDAYRAGVAADRSGRQLAEIVGRLEVEGYEIGGEELKRVPPGYPADHPRARLLRFKGLIAWKNLGLNPWLGSSEAKERIATAWRDMQPLGRWFDAVLG
jgi:uncharacterized protein (TIGR02453 family)